MTDGTDKQNVKSSLITLTKGDIYNLPDGTVSGKLLVYSGESYDHYGWHNFNEYDPKEPMNGLYKKVWMQIIRPDVEDLGITKVIYD